jgi:simple sugar transport system ATP-binding protein
MAGGQELAELSHELRGVDPAKVVEAHTVEHGGIEAPVLSEDEIVVAGREPKEDL